jgi:parallel beta-helix repeat protein
MNVKSNRLKKGLVFGIVFVLVFVVFSGIPMNVSAEGTNEIILEGEHGVFGNGTVFKITNSTYLNVTLTSSKNVQMDLESVPKIVSFHIKANCTSTSTELTITGFKACKKYYRYQDGYLQENFTTNETGSYVYTQNISTHHHIYIQEETSTLYISSDYTFKNDIYDAIVVTADNIVIDGNGYTLQGTGSGYGIYLNNRLGITITNVAVSGFTYGIYLHSSSSNTISGNTVSGNNRGIYLFRYSSSNTISGNMISDNSDYGIFLRRDCSSNTISGNTVSDNWWGIHEHQNSHTNTISGNTVSGSWYGIYMRSSPRNTITGNTVSGNNRGFRLYYSHASSIFHNNIIDNTVQLYVDVHESNTWHNGDEYLKRQGNYWSDYTGLDDGSYNRVANDGVGDTNIPHLGSDWHPLMSEWNPDPLDSIEKLKNYIKGLDIHHGTKKSLLSQLNATENALGNEQYHTAVNILNAFINHVEAAIKSKKLTQEQGEYIISSAQAIIALIESK